MIRPIVPHRGERRVVRMQRELHARLLRDRDGTLEEPGERLPEELLLDRGTRRGCHSLPHRRVEAGHHRAAAALEREGRARPRDDGHPVVTPHLDPQLPHHAEHAEHRLELLLAAREPEPEAIHRRVVLEHGEAEAGVLDLLPVERRAGRAPRAARAHARASRQTRAAALPPPPRSRAGAAAPRRPWGEARAGSRQGGARRDGIGFRATAKPGDRLSRRHRQRNRRPAEAGAGRRPASAGRPGLHAPAASRTGSPVSTASPSIGKSFGLPVARVAPTPTAAAATRQSACASVTPRSANERRHSPASSPSSRPRRAIRRPSKRSRAVSTSEGRRPRTVSSTLTAHVQSASRPPPASFSLSIVPGRPRNTSIRTVVSSRSAATRRYPTRAAAVRRSARTQAAGSSSHA